MRKRVGVDKPIDELRKYIEERVVIVPWSGCWLWELTLDRGGYGLARDAKSRVCNAHRVSYTAFYGEIPAGLQVLHSCHVRSCVNPDHLRLGTQAENGDDMAMAGRARRLLSTEQVTHVRSLRGKRSVRQIAVLMGVAPNTIQKILHNKTRKFG